MIARHWKGTTKPGDAEHYVAHVRNDTFEKLAGMQGFIEGSIQRRSVDGGIEFLIETRWQSIESIRQFAGDDPETAVVPPEAQKLLVKFDKFVVHYEMD